MKQNNLIIICLLLFITACTVQSTPQEQNPFEQACRANNHAWMKMAHIVEGMIVGPACDGCMPDGKNHLCSQQEYEEHLKK